MFAPNLGIGIQQRTFDWYYQGDLPGCGLGNELRDTTAISDTLAQCISTHDRFWVVMRNNQTEPSVRYRSYFLESDQTDMSLIKEHHFVEISVYLFELSK